MHSIFVLATHQWCLQCCDAHQALPEIDEECIGIFATRHAAETYLRGMSEIITDHDTWYWSLEEWRLNPDDPEYPTEYCNWLIDSEAEPVPGCWYYDRAGVLLPDRPTFSEAEQEDEDGYHPLRSQDEVFDRLAPCPTCQTTTQLLLSMADDGWYVECRTCQTRCRTAPTMRGVVEAWRRVGKRGEAKTG